jgi:hypothetical protein
VATNVVSVDTSSLATAASALLESTFPAFSSGQGLPTAFPSTDLLLSFADQGQNLAGIFFQASLLPYLLFLYFLSFRANRISSLGNFGFQFVLLFVVSTIPSGIIAKSVYGTSLANVDWLHGGAETLLTLANILVVSTVTKTSLLRHVPQPTCEIHVEPVTYPALPLSPFSNSITVDTRVLNLGFGLQSSHDHSQSIRTRNLEQGSSSRFGRCRNIFCLYGGRS